jgi:uncharacterized repeat protein (TIGR01451 family)
MGRRFTILTALMFTLTSALARGQTAKTGDKAGNAGASAPLPPISPADESEERSDVGSKPISLQAAESNFSAAPERATDQGFDKDAKESPRSGGRLVRAPRDSAVKRVQAAGDASAPGPQAAPAVTPPVAAAAASNDRPASPSVAGNEAQGEGAGFVLPPDRLPLGKQEVVLSVDVHAPADMTFNRDATVKISVKNSGSTDALGVVVRDELPAGLAYVSSQPEAQKVGDSLLSWRISTLPAASERVILLKVRPTKAGGALDQAATVTFQAGSKATSRILRPRLKLEVVQTPTEGKVLRNKSAEFRISITNTGDGPARNVTVQAKLSPGLRHDTGERNEDNSFELPIQELGPGQREDLDSLTVEALQGGEQWCRVTATSADVDFEKESAQITRTIEVVEPKLKMTLTGPDKRYTDTVAPYAITLENPGTAPARNVRVLATLGVSGRLVGVPPGAKYDTTSRRLQWTIPQLDPGDKPRTLAFEVRMGGISAYEVNVETRGDNALYVKDRRITDVQGMPDVELYVRERRRVVDVDGTTTFQIRLRNYGTKEAAKLQLAAKLSSNLTVDSTAGGPDGEAFAKDGEVKFPIIERLGPGKEMLLGIKVKVTSAQPKIGTCRVQLLHDDLTEPLEHMASVKVTETRRAASIGP